MEMDEMKRILAAAEVVRAALGEAEIGLILGSGLGEYANEMTQAKCLAYSDIPGFPVSTVAGHAGQFVCGTLWGKRVIMMQGRFHYYEGYPMELVTLPIRVMKVLGIQYLFVSNAAGGVNFDFKVGDLMVITDHINHLPNPLIGPNMAEFGPRFPDMTRPYDKNLRMRAFEIAAGLGFGLKSGVYFAGTGPSYETPAEYKYFRLIGADAVGMSTIPEVIVARHSDIPVFGMSVITNEAHDDYAEDYVNDADDVVEAADTAADKMTAIFTKLIETL